MSTQPGGGPQPDGLDPAPASRADGAKAREELDQLQTLLFPERQHWMGLATRLDDPSVRAAETAAVLPESVRQALARGPGLATTIAPVVEDAIHSSVRHDPGRLVDAIFPVMGPAIRRSISATIRDMVESLNQMLESSVSWRGLMWRMEARRTGKPFGEIMLLHTLLFQVQQVFLIHQRTGLLLQHVVAPTVGMQDPSIVSGMLTAIQDFVNESFNAGAPGTLDTLQVGELTVWIESGPHAYVAAIVRGHAPVELRAALQDTLARIHGESSVLLERFGGDADPFDAFRPLLEACLQSQTQEPRRAGLSWPLRVVLGALVVAAGAWIYTAARADQQWGRLLDRFRREPGFVLVTAERSGGHGVVAGLRDPLAADPARLESEAGYAPGEIVNRWDSYDAAHPEFVETRAAALLKAPPTVVFQFDTGVLRMFGRAPQAWIDERAKLAPFVPGVQRVQPEGLRAQELVDVDACAVQVDSHRVAFAPDSAAFDDAARQEIGAVVSNIRDLLAAAARTGQTVAIEVVGRTDDTGSLVDNQKLAARRADAVLAALVAAGLPRTLFVSRSSPADVKAGAGDAERAAWRVVDFTTRLHEPQTLPPVTR